MCIRGFRTSVFPKETRTFEDSDKKLIGAYFILHLETRFNRNKPFSL